MLWLSQFYEHLIFQINYLMYINQNMTTDNTVKMSSKNQNIFKEYSYFF